MTQDQTHERVLQGIGVSPGIAIGPAYVFSRRAYQATETRIDPGEVEDQQQRFDRAVRQSEKELQKIADVAREKIGQQSAEIFVAQMMMLRDQAVYDDVLAMIERDLVPAENAVKEVLDYLRKRMEVSTNEYLRARADDFSDIEDRLLRNLQRGTIVSRIENDRVVLAETLTAADIVLFSRRNILGCAMAFGGATSHVSLMARALGIPAIVSLHDVVEHADSEDLVIIDGLNGRLIIRPTPNTVEVYRARRERYLRLREEQKTLIPLPSETMDGTHIRLQSNVEVEEELPLLKRYRAEGIGLFRTELLFFTKGQFPAEEEQVVTYRKAIEAARPYVTTFRLFDLGGDKVMPMAHREHNPFLGWRGIRILLDREDLLKAQVRAILRASVHGPCHLLIPMVTTVEEIKTFKKIYADVQADLTDRGVPFDASVPIGVMVEVPSVALQADIFAREVDFFSLGTNDLTQYLLAVDRGNDLVSKLYHELHPSVLQLIAQTVAAAGRAGIPVSICGEMAAQPRAVPILLGLGLRSLSTSPTYMLDIKRVVRAISIDEAESLARQALEQPDAESVEALVDAWLEEHCCSLSQLLELVGADPANSI